MSQYVASIAVDAVIAALGAFIQPFVPGGTIVRGQGNRVPQPEDPCVILMEISQVDIETPIDVFDPENNQVNIAGPKQIGIQIDFYGVASGDYCAAVKTVYRSPYAPAQFPDGIKPLFCSDGQQSPLITGEEQYESRWTLTANLQYNPVVSVPQDSADELELTSIEAFS